MPYHSKKLSVAEAELTMTGEGEDSWLSKSEVEVEVAVVLVEGMGESRVLALVLEVMPLEREEDKAEDFGGPVWYGMPLESKILEICCWMSPEKLSRECSKSAASEMGRTEARFPMPFQLLRFLYGDADGVGTSSPALLSAACSAPPVPTTTAFSISSANHSNSSSAETSMSSGISLISSSLSSQDSGSLKMRSASALPGMPLREMGVGETSGESSMSRSGMLKRAAALDMVVVWC